MLQIYSQLQEQKKNSTKRIKNKKEKILKNSKKNNKKKEPKKKSKKWLIISLIVFVFLAIAASSLKIPVKKQNVNVKKNITNITTVHHKKPLSANAMQEAYIHKIIKTAPKQKKQIPVTMQEQDINIQNIIKEQNKQKTIIKEVNKTQPVAQTQTKTIIHPKPIKKPVYITEHFCKNETPLKAQAVFYVKLNDKFIPVYLLNNWNGKGILFKPFEIKKAISIVNFDNKTYYEISKGKYLINTKNSAIKCSDKKVSKK